MTNIKQFGGNVWMRVKTWHEMISFSFKTLHIWIENIRKGVSIYHKPCNLNSTLGSPTSGKCVHFPRCWWNQWDSSPIHHRYSNTNSMWTHVIIWSQWCHFYGCHIWHKWHEISSIYLDGVWWSLHKCPFSLDHYKYANSSGFAWMVETIKR